MASKAKGTRRGDEASAADRQQDVVLGLDEGGVDGRAPRIKKALYLEELARLQLELVKLQDWVKAKGLRVVVLFEGRDAAGKGGTIKRVTESLNPRVCRVVALGTPTERERSQWYFQRYVANLPAAGEMVLFDRSWYNRAGVEHVMGFCTEEEYREFLRAAPEFERMLQNDGILLVKYWFSVSDDEQERRFRERIEDRAKRWKLSPMDVESRSRWVEYSKAKDEMFRHTDTEHSPWVVVPSDDKRRAHLNVIRHLLGLIPYEELPPVAITLPPRQSDEGYVRPPITEQNFIPDHYADLVADEGGGKGGKNGKGGKGGKGGKADDAVVKGGKAKTKSAA